MKIGNVLLPSPFAVAPMAGMTDTAFRRLVKRHGGCGLVVTEMVSSEGLVRGIDRTLEYAEYTEEERPISIQIFGGDPEKMAAAAEIVEGMGADFVDVNMGCPVPKIARHSAGCSLMREPRHAASIVAAMTKAVRIPVTVKMRAGWNDSEKIFARWRSGVDGVLVGRGVLRNPWILAQAADLAAGRTPREVTLADRGRFLLDYIELLRHERVREPQGFRHAAPWAGRSGGEERHATGRDRWVINKLRALGSWYTKGLENGSHLRTAINSAESIDALQAIVGGF